SPQHDQGLRPDDLRATGATAPDRVDHALEVIHVADAQPYERIGISGQSESFDELRQTVDRRVDLGDLGPGRESQLGECLEVAPERSVVEDRRVPANVPCALETVD